MTPIQLSHKNNAFKLSEQVKANLHAKGYSFLFNYQDYQYYKAKAKKAFNRAQEIADLFIQDNTAENDFSQYIF